VYGADILYVNCPLGCFSTGDSPPRQGHVPQLVIKLTAGKQLSMKQTLCAGVALH